MGKWICNVQAEEALAHKTNTPLPRRQEKQNHQRREREPIGERATWCLTKRIQNQDEHTHHREENFRCGQGEIELGLHHGEAYSFEMDTCCNRASTETCMTSVKGLGWTPI